MGKLSHDDAKARLADLAEGWALDEDGTALARSFETRNFLSAQNIALLAGAIGEAMGHHPDLSYGWGHARIVFTSHDAGGLTARDFDVAARLDAALG
ncbi:MAG: 4a-hydroxytetrahydrobiopterin dehydratase [Paracoccus sp. (in: a-proteobacteria)]|nr:4a-hydroxytetrahydrobiopterin dehydratase [Paracoccus sp. (in: a-proteobacteria)]